MKRIVAVSLLFVFAGAGELAWARQPVMDMMPRWKGGYGFQYAHSSRSSSTLKEGDSKIDNPFGRKRRVEMEWLEGVYSFNQERRVSFKIPWVNQSRTALGQGAPVKETGTGWGDLILGFLFKKYWDQGNTTANVSVVPSVRIPTGSTDDAYPVGDGSTDFGLSFSYNRDTPRTYQYYEAFYWLNGHGRRGISQGDEIGINADLGLNVYRNQQKNWGIMLAWSNTLRHEMQGVDQEGETGGTLLSMGPMLMFSWRNFISHVAWKMPVYEYLQDRQVSYGPELQIEAGIAF
jgi:hypothetical protein